MYDKDKKEKYLQEGRAKEIEFAELFDEYTLSNEIQNVVGHWDLKLGKYKIDVKALKKVNRKDDNKNENIHWIEIKGITGELGWLYGEADFFAFETIDYWIVVEKNRLQNFIKNTTIKEFVEVPTLYKLYNRKDRKDVLTLIKTIDLCYLSKKIIKKT